MAKELHYNGSEISMKTDCPYKATYDKKFGPIKIGSIACSECKWFVSDDTEKKIVTCSHS